MEPWMIRACKGLPTRPAWIEDENGCWRWQGYIRDNGYGKSGSRGDAYAHRAVYKAFVGDIPDDLEVHHRCAVRDCVRPDHLELVSHRENVLLGDSAAAQNAAKTHCPKGHPYDTPNTWVNPQGQRRCRPCKNIRERARYARTKEHVHA